MINDAGGAHGRRRFGRLAFAGGAVAAVLLAMGAGVASANQSPNPGPSHYGVVPMRGTAVSPQVEAAAASDLVYHGGSIQQHPAIYLVFWGTQWNSDRSGAQDYVTKFFTGLGNTNDNWSRVTSQYTGTNGKPTFTGSVLKGTWVDAAGAAPSRASANAIAAEARRGLSHFGASTGPNVDIIVLSPHGTHPDGFPNAGFCAWHDATGGLPYTNMPYVSDAGRSCGANSVRSALDGFSLVAGHEYLEVVTDPIPPSGWIDRSGAENADKCAWKNLHAITLGTGSFAVQPTWSNQVHGCAG
jgi:serine protease